MGSSSTRTATSRHGGRRCEGPWPPSPTRFPTRRIPHGTIVVAEGLPRLGLWLWPDNTSPGIAEDFVAKLAPPGDVVLAHARTVVGALPETRFPAVARSKAVLHTWLAWQERPATPSGLAVTRRYVDGDHELARRFVTWLRRVFG